MKLTKPSIFILHFFDIGRYPPAFNLIKYFSDSKYFEKIIISSRSKYAVSYDNVLWKNSGNNENKNTIFRISDYLTYYFKCLLHLLKYQPDNILYYESLSFPPAMMYSLLRKVYFKKTKIYCHYHEYSTSQQYQSGMFLMKIANIFEKKWYNTFDWISHTNTKRLELFIKDNQGIKTENLHILPNYPPANWSVNKKEYNYGKIIKIVYVGSLDLNTMYTKEFSEWVISQNGKVIWDVYSGQLNAETLEYFNKLSTPYIQFLGRIDYTKLPFTLIQYDLGVILYKGKHINMIYNEPNKYFEYITCGLDVWFPKEVLGMQNNIQTTKKPLVLSLDFNNLSKNDLLTIINTEYPHEYRSYIAEEVYKTLLGKIIESKDDHRN